jgi:hypothetical protein
MPGDFKKIQRLKTQLNWICVYRSQEDKDRYALTLSTQDWQVFANEDMIDLFYAFRKFPEIKRFIFKHADDNLSKAIAKGFIDLNEFNHTPDSFDYGLELHYDCISYKDYMNLAVVYMIYPRKIALELMSDHFNDMNVVALSSQPWLPLYLRNKKGTYSSGINLDFTYCILSPDAQLENSLVDSGFLTTKNDVIFLLTKHMTKQIEGVTSIREKAITEALSLLRLEAPLEEPSKAQPVDIIKDYLRPSAITFSAVPDQRCEDLRRARANEVFLDSRPECSLM